MADRAAAFREALDLLRNSYIEIGVEDVLIVADWLATGTSDLALQLNDQRARLYRDHVVGVSPDAATWQPAVGEES